MNLRETRQFYNLSQAEVADILSVPIRTYHRYESDDNYGDKFKRECLIDMINKKFEISEEKGLLTIEHIKKTIIPVLKRIMSDKSRSSIICKIRYMITG